MRNEENSDQNKPCKYTDLKEKWENDKIDDCCKSDTPTDPPGGDCCYDSWKDELKEVKKEVEQITEDAKLCQVQLEIVIERRNKLKKWTDELTDIEEMAVKICDQLALLKNQSGAISNNTGQAVDAIKLLFCMIKDFYVQLDIIRAKYDELINCIKCLNHPLLEEGNGIIKCLEGYFTKLEAVQKTKEAIIKLILEAIHLSDKLDKNLDDNYGLQQIIDCWKKKFSCEVPCEELEKEQKSKQPKNKANNEGCLDENADWDPIITLPICNDDYYKCIQKRYKEDKDKAKTVTEALKKKNTKKEKLTACKTSLEAAIAEVDPKNRC